ncbi:DoxX family protein [Gordonia sp. zg691]|uniref:DoxX family protein n=1 Tax=Gordonia jinghuaiqii TaxID=2758710 RepID=A0A7D7LWX3_9ACTN|nr:DoxX family protein [Gordonia jinghuaiqii]MCR5980374.1 DoxX family protein [Gordonia jinghuaiqii]QMT03681.1 DoxX family protein [Gordonia jinghuaiqii]
MGFRFLFLYTALFCLIFAQITFVYTGILGTLLPDDAIIWQMTALAPALSWVGHNVFGVDATLRMDSGSGDQTAIWILMFCILVAAAALTAVWSFLDRNRPGYTRLSAWWMTFLRLCLGGQMLFYGFAKLIPSQMPPPSLSALLQPYGEFSPASVLWLQVGSSPVYEMLLGGVEVLGGILLFWTRTTTLGVLVSFVAMVQVFILNMTFDVPVKILSAHLVLLSLILLAPQFKNLFAMFVLERPASAPVTPRLFDTPERNRWSTRVQILLGVWVVLGTAQISWSGWHEYGSAAPKTELYGIWEVRQFSLDGREVPPLTTDQDRWRRVVFEVPGAVTVQQMNADLVTRPAVVDVDRGIIELPAPESAEPAASLRFERPAEDRLVLSGSLDGQQALIVLDRFDENSLPLLGRGFHWVQEEPYFR